MGREIPGVVIPTIPFIIETDLEEIIPEHNTFYSVYPIPSRNACVTRKFQTITLSYGIDKAFTCDLPEERVEHVFSGPQPNTQFREQLKQSLRAPLEYPALHQAILPDDQIVLALDPQTPCAEILIAELWNVLAQVGVSPSRITILESIHPWKSIRSGYSHDPRRALDSSVQQQMQWKVHSDQVTEHCSYLATSSHGERLYLAKELLDADVVITIGTMAFNKLTGYRGTNSVLYPGLSSGESQRKSRGEGHQELQPENVRPLRQLMDEVGWLLGTQFTLQVIPDARGGVAYALAGLNEAVFREGCRLLNQSWAIQLSERVETVVLTLKPDPLFDPWEQFGKALATALDVVSHDGRLIILSELNAALSPGLSYLVEVMEPHDVIKWVLEERPVDMNVLTTLVQAVNSCHVHFLSHLEDELVEELFMSPLGSEEEVTRLLQFDHQCLFLENPHYVLGQIE